MSIDAIYVYIDSYIIYIELGIVYIEILVFPDVEIFVSIWHPLQTVQVAVTLPAEKLCPHPAHGAVPEQPPNPILRLPEPIVAMTTV